MAGTRIKSPIPRSRRTFQRSKLNWDEAHEGIHAEMLEWYTKLIHIRRASPSLNDGDTNHVSVGYNADKHWLVIDRGEMKIVTNLGSESAELDVPDRYRLIAQSHAGINLLNDKIMLPPDSLALLSREEE